VMKTESLRRARRRAISLLAPAARLSEAAPKPTLMFYNFQTHLLTPVLQLEEQKRQSWERVRSPDSRATSMNSSATAESYAFLLDVPSSGLPDRMKLRANRDTGI
jgi:hypothetical protein